MIYKSGYNRRFAGDLYYFGTEHDEDVALGHLKEYEVMQAGTMNDFEDK